MKLDRDKRFYILWLIAAFGTGCNERHFEHNDPSDHKFTLLDAIGVTVSGLVILGLAYTAMMFLSFAGTKFFFNRDPEYDADDRIIPYHFLLTVIVLNIAIWMAITNT